MAQRPSDAYDRPLPRLRNEKQGSDDMRRRKGRPVSLRHQQPNRQQSDGPINGIDPCRAAKEVMAQPGRTVDVLLMNIENDEAAQSEKEIDARIAEGEVF